MIHIIISYIEEEDSLLLLLGLESVLCLCYVTATVSVSSDIHFIYTVYSHGCVFGETSLENIMLYFIRAFILCSKV